MEKEFRKKLLAIVLLGVVIRLGFSFWVPTQPVSDAWSYYQRAVNLITISRYEAIIGRADAHYPPLYPLLLTGAFLLTGSKAVLIGKLINALLGGISIFLVGQIAYKFFNNSPLSLLSALLLALYPQMIVMSNILVSENLFNPLVLIFILILFWSIETRPNLTNSLVAGFVIGLLTMTRSIAQLMWLFWIIPLTRELRQKPKSMLLLGAVFIAMTLTLVPWGLRNWYALGKYTYSSSGGINFIIGNNPGSPGTWYPGWFADAQTLDPEIGSSANLVETDDAMMRAGLKWVAQSPGTALKLFFRKLWLHYFYDNYVIDLSLGSIKISPPTPPIAPLDDAHPLRSIEAQVYRFMNLTVMLVQMLQFLGISLWVFANRKNALSSPTWLKFFSITVVSLYLPVMSSAFLASPRYTWPANVALMPFLAYAVLYPFKSFRSNSG